MAFFATRKQGESSEKVVNRWKKLTQRFSRAARFDQNFKKEPRKWQIREGALKREGYRTERKRKQFYS